MSDRPLNQKPVKVLNETYDHIKAINQSMADKKEVPVSLAITMRDIVNFYVQAHQGKK